MEFVHQLALPCSLTLTSLPLSHHLPSFWIPSLALFSATCVLLTFSCQLGGCSIWFCCESIWILKFYLRHLSDPHFASYLSSLPKLSALWPCPLVTSALRTQLSHFNHAIHISLAAAEIGSRFLGIVAAPRDFQGHILGRSNLPLHRKIKSLIFSLNKVDPCL